MRTVLVTGGAGFLGYHLVVALLEEDPEVRVVVVDDLSTPGSRERAHRLTASSARVRLEDIEADAGAVLAARSLTVSEIWHLASPASPPLYKARPLDTLRLGGEVLDVLLSLANEDGARLIFASTSEVYGDPLSDSTRPFRSLPLAEDEPGRVHCDGPRSMYDEAKRYGEALCAAWRTQAAVDARVVRIFNTYGPHQDHRDGRLVPRLLWSAATGEAFPIHGSGLQSRTLAHVSDTIAGMLAVARAPSVSGPVNVGSDLDGERSVADLVEIVRSLPGAKAFDAIPHPRQDEHDPRRRLPDLTRLRSLGWQPRVGLVDGLGSTLDWMRASLLG